MARGYAPGKAVPRRYPKKDLPILRAAARRYGIPARILAAQEFVESGFADDVTAGTRRSSTGAFGRSQFMPGTAASYHVRPGLSKSAIRSQVFGHAHYLHDLGASKDLRRAIASYAGGPGNPQYGYAQTVLNLSRSYRGIGKGKALPASQGGSGGPTGTVTHVKTVQPPPYQPTTGLADLLASQTQHVMTPVGASAPAEPTFSARQHLALPKGYAAAPSTGAPVAATKTGLSDQLRAIEDAANTQPVERPAVTTKTTTRVGGQNAPGRVSGDGGQQGKLRIAPGANRAGVGVQPVLTHFLRHAAGIAGIPITVTTGTNHNRMTTTGNVSDHWDGHAGDIAVAVDSRKGDRIATAALIAAGVGEKRAAEMARRGGAYTLNHAGHRIQIIWKSMVGGNHHNHVHVGIR